MAKGCVRGLLWRSRNSVGIAVWLSDSESASPIAPDFKSVAADSGTLSDEIRVWQNVAPKAEQVSFCRIWADFRDAAFECAKQSREKNRHFLHKTAPLCNVLWGIFTF